MTVTGPAASTFPLHSRGRFSLAASSRFLEGFPAGQSGGNDGAAGARLDLAFPVERDWQPIGVRVTDGPAGLLATVVANPGRVDLTAVRGQVERILSLDIDGGGFTALAERDPVVGALQQRYPGLRPVQFHTPYEAAAWAIIGQRIRMTQAATVKNRLATDLGEPVDFGDLTLPAFPAPDRLADLGPTRGLTDRKVDQLRALARAAADGQLDADRLRQLPREQALAQLQTLPGIGPWPPPTTSATTPTRKLFARSPTVGGPTARGSRCCSAPGSRTRPARLSSAATPTALPKRSARWARPVDRSSSPAHPSALVDLAAVPERDNDHQEHVIGDGVDDAVVTDTYAEARSALQGAGGRGARVLRQESDHALHAVADRRVEVPERSNGGRPQLDAVVRHTQPRSALTCSQGMLAPSSAIAASNAVTSSESSSAAVSLS